MASNRWVTASRFFGMPFLKYKRILFTNPHISPVAERRGEGWQILFTLVRIQPGRQKNWKDLYEPVNITTIIFRCDAQFIAEFAIEQLRRSLPRAKRRVALFKVCLAMQHIKKNNAALYIFFIVQFKFIFSNKANRNCAANMGWLFQSNTIQQ